MATSLRRRGVVLAAAHAVLALGLLGRPSPVALLQADSSTLLRQGVSLGVAVAPVGTGTSPTTALAAYESATGAKAAVVGVYRAWAGPTAALDATTLATLARWSDEGRAVMITWEPWNPALGTAQAAYSLREIAAGKHDAYLRSWALSLAALGRTVYLRPMHEMNGNWYPWAGGVNGNSPSDFVAAWRHLHEVFTAHGATNVRWVWAPNRSDAPATNTLEQYWPGRDTVDVLGIDGYSCYSGWTSFADVVRAPYARVTALDPGLPVWVTETGVCPPSASVAGSAGRTRAEWLTAIGSTTGLPRLTAVVYFDVDGGFAWRIDGDAAAVRAVRDLQATPRAGAPASPAAPTLTPATGKVTLTWPAVAGATSYRVLRDGVPTLATLTTTATDVVPGDVPHSWAVAAIASGAMSAPGPARSGQAVAVPVPGAVTGLAAAPGSTRISLSWTATANATGYVVRRAGVVVARPTTPGWADSPLPTATTQTYSVSATSSAGEGPQTTVSSTTLPAVPTGLTATAAPGSVTLAWTPSTGATGYRVYRDGSTTPLLTVTTKGADGAVVPVAVDVTVTAGRTYSWTVAAYSTSGQTAKSTAVTATAR